MYIMLHAEPVLVVAYTCQRLLKNTTEGSFTARMGWLASGIALTNGPVEDHANGPGNCDVLPASMISERLVDPELTPSDAFTVKGYVPIAEVPGFNATSPLFPPPGCTTLRLGVQ